MEKNTGLTQGHRAAAYAADLAARRAAGMGQTDRAKELKKNATDNERAAYIAEGDGDAAGNDLIDWDLYEASL